MIHKAMQHFGITDPAAVGKVGDTLSDIEEGRNAGCGLVVAITTGAVAGPVLAAANPDACIEELEELIAKMEGR
jgi:phosphoglycolate phosphatase-like HAD superfamily hydrolase